MKIIVAPDSFKGSLSANEVADAISDVILSRHPNFEVVKIPLADGGEGTDDILAPSFPEVVKVEAADPLGRMRTASYRVNPFSSSTFIESAKVIGLPLLQPEERNPMVASSYGLGEVIKDATKKGYKKIFISLGGSATCDGGMGMAEALGYRFFDQRGKPLKASGGNLRKIASILPSYDFDLERVNFTVFCDVNNPLLGPQGAAEVFAPQKGAAPEDVRLLEEGLGNLNHVCLNSGLAKEDFALRPGAGAAGGLGYGALTFLSAELLKGIDFILDTVNFDEKIRDADLIITGEGKVDCQSLMGKVVGGILACVQNTGKDIPVIVVAGLAEDKDLLLKSGITAIHTIADPRLTLQENLHPSVALCNLHSLRIF